MKTSLLELRKYAENYEKGENFGSLVKASVKFRILSEKNRKKLAYSPLTCRMVFRCFCYKSTQEYEGEPRKR